MPLSSRNRRPLCYNGVWGADRLGSPDFFLQPGSGYFQGLGITGEVRVGVAVQREEPGGCAGSLKRGNRLFDLRDIKDLVITQRVYPGGPRQIGRDDERLQVAKTGFDLARQIALAEIGNDWAGLMEGDDVALTRFRGQSTAWRCDLCVMLSFVVNRGVDINDKHFLFQCLSQPGLRSRITYHASSKGAISLSG